MNHDQIKEKIFEFYDGESDAEDAHDLQAHLNSCSECRQELSEWKKTSALFLKDTTPIMNTEHFVTRVMARLPEQAEHSVGFLLSPFWKLGFALTGFVVVVWSYLSMNTASSDSIETLLLADSRAVTVSNWVMGDESIASDEFAQYTLEE